MRLWPALRRPGPATQLFRPVSLSAGPVAALKRQQVNQTLIAGIINAGLEKNAVTKNDLCLPNFGASVVRLGNSTGTQASSLDTRTRLDAEACKCCPGAGMGAITQGPPPTHREILSRVAHTHAEAIPIVRSPTTARLTGCTARPDSGAPILHTSAFLPLSRHWAGSSTTNCTFLS